jgi:hypothetical protein
LLAFQQCDCITNCLIANLRAPNAYKDTARQASSATPAPRFQKIAKFKPAPMLATAFSLEYNSR